MSIASDPVRRTSPSDLMVYFQKTVTGVILRTGSNPHEIRMSSNTIAQLVELARFPSDSKMDSLFGIPIKIDEKITDGHCEPRYYYGPIETPREPPQSAYDPAAWLDQALTYQTPTITWHQI